MTRRPLLLRLLAGLLMLGLAPSAPFEAAAAEQTAEAGAIQAVIERQLAAFGRDDGPGAFAFASPGIRDRFRTAEIFMDMVRRHYAPVYRPRDVAFGPLRQGPDGPVQELLLVGPDGRSVTALYFMERQPDGSWRIKGVRLVDAPDLTT